ncbi:PREDICTED: slit homolog 3 protein-like [Branchiostoma belcheri]|uniref:Slit homolog 3 protein-like n=1 Tax=Branchiostoma belcheri TaxID=7741 RepID=A0A6P4Y4K6_BRABE|nr:PREDICTED: slit homolog 3 protein-like [Branchiostoma belcheri]
MRKKIGFAAILWLCLLLPVVCSPVPTTTSSTSLTRCPRNCTCEDIAGGAVVDCKGQNLTALPTGLPLNTTYLNVAYNSLTKLKLTHLYNLTKLEGLSVSNNDISVIKGSLKYFSNLNQVDMSTNMIQTVKETVFGNLLQKLRLAEMSDNPLNCDCHLKWLREAVNNTELLGNNVYCANPPHLSGKRFLDVPSADFKCNYYDDLFI